MHIYIVLFLKKKRDKEISAKMQNVNNRHICPFTVNNSWQAQAEAKYC